eukprot:2539741-Rhodomonas_salina.1
MYGATGGPYLAPFRPITRRSQPTSPGTLLRFCYGPSSTELGYSPTHCLEGAGRGEEDARPLAQRT